MAHEPWVALEVLSCDSLPNFFNENPIWRISTSLTFLICHVFLKTSTSLSVYSLMATSTTSLSAILLTWNQIPKLSKFSHHLLMSTVKKYYYNCRCTSLFFHVQMISSPSFLFAISLISLRTMRLHLDDSPT